MLRLYFNSLKTLLFGFFVIFIWGWLDLQFRYFDTVFLINLPSWLIVPGIFLIITGGIIAFTTAFTFVFAGKGTPAPFDPPNEFVSVGLYKYVRNPMYIGGFLLFSGYAFVNRSFSMIIFPIIWLLIVHLFVLYYEEKTLEKKFGLSYLNYKQKVNRWIPKIFQKPK